MRLRPAVAPEVEVRAIRHDLLGPGIADRPRPERDLFALLLEICAGNLPSEFIDLRLIEAHPITESGDVLAVTSELFHAFAATSQ